MQEELAIEIERKARSVLAKERSKLAGSHRYANRFRKRTAMHPIVVAPVDPQHWEFHPHFNPVHSIRHAKYISKQIWRSIQEDTYSPIPAVQFDIAKPTGGTRPIMAFGIPDAALANLLHRRLTVKNVRLFSNYSYAYRSDRSVFDAVLHLQRSILADKTYIVQFDFKSFFDSISHSYINKIIHDKERFIISQAERNIISAFLRHEYFPYLEYGIGEPLSRTRGVPQGSSLSLFLANISAHDLDRALEHQNGTFVRFADDVVAVTRVYEDAQRVAKQFRIHCENAGLELNFEKSPGIKYFDIGPSLDRRTMFIDKDDAGDLETINEFDFLGHSFTHEGTGLSKKGIDRVKKKISRIIYIHLLLYPKNNQFNPLRISPTAKDWDLVTCLNEIRRYMYGGLYEREIDSFLNDGERLRAVRGLMSFYPLVTDASCLAVLDGWLVSAVRRALRERNRILNSRGLATHQITTAELLTGGWYEDDVKNESSIPSFIKGWRAARKYYLRFGLNNIKPPSYYSLTAIY